MGSQNRSEQGREEEVYEPGFAKYETASADYQRGDLTNSSDRLKSAPYSETRADPWRVQVGEPVICSLDGLASRLSQRGGSCRLRSSETKACALVGYLVLPRFGIGSAAAAFSSNQP